MKEPSVMGVTFHVDKHEMLSGSNVKVPTKYLGLVTLKAHFNREDLWKKVVQRLNGLTLYKGGDIQTELIGILQGQVELLEKQVQSMSHTDRERAQRAEQAASLARAEAARATQHVELLQAQLEMRTRERDTYQQYMKQWQAWYDNHKAHCPVP